MTDIRESLRKLENQSEDYIWRTAKAAGEEIDRLRALTAASAHEQGRREGIEMAAAKVVFCGECDCPRLSQEAIRALSSAPPPEKGTVSARPIYDVPTPDEVNQALAEECAEATAVNS